MPIKLFNSEEEVNAFLGITPIGEPDLSWVQPQHQKAVLAIVKLFNVHEAHNKANNFEPDWSNSSQRKYSALHWLKKDASKQSGFGFSYACYDGWDTYTIVSSRLSVGTPKEATHIGEKFDYLYQDLYFILPIAEEVKATDEDNANPDEYQDEWDGK